MLKAIVASISFVGLAPLGTAVLTTAGFGTSVLAETPEGARIGRFTDGQAYRIDAGGFQIVDQMAEMEVTIAELKGQVAELERALNSKSPGQRASLPNVAAAPVKICPPAAKCDCVSQDSTIQAQLTALETERLKQSERLLAKQADEESERAQLATELENKDVKIAKLEKALESKSEQIVQLASDRDSLKNSLGSTQDQVALLKQQTLQEARQERGRLLEETPRAKKLEIQPASAATSGTAPVDASELRERLASIQKLIGRRKDLADSIRSSGRGVGIQMQPLVASDGNSLDRLRVAAQSGSPVVLKGIREIESILNDDVTLLSRLRNGR